MVDLGQSAMDEGVIGLPKSFSNGFASRMVLRGSIFSAIKNPILIILKVRMGAKFIHTFVHFIVMTKTYQVIQSVER